MPDYFVRHADGTAIVIDVRPDARVKPADEEVFSATAALCASVGWGYQRLGGLPPAYAASLRWIAGYRHPRCPREEITGLVVARLQATGPQSIRELASAVGRTTITPLAPTTVPMVPKAGYRAQMPPSPRPSRARDYYRPPLWRFRHDHVRIPHGVCVLFTLHCLALVLLPCSLRVWFACFGCE